MTDAIFKLFQGKTSDKIVIEVSGDSFNGFLNDAKLKKLMVINHELFASKNYVNFEPT